MTEYWGQQPAGKLNLDKSQLLYSPLAGMSSVSGRTAKVQDSDGSAAMAHANIAASCLRNRFRRRQRGGEVQDGIEEKRLPRFFVRSGKSLSNWRIFLFEVILP